MFESLKSLIDSRLGKNIVLDDFITEEGFFIKIPPPQTYSVAFFLKNDPDVRLTLLDHIIALPCGVLPWKLVPDVSNVDVEILYQFKSLKLPYRVTLALDLAKDVPLMSIAPLYAGARWLEIDLANTHGVSFEESDRR